MRGLSWLGLLVAVVAAVFACAAPALAQDTNNPCYGPVPTADGMGTASEARCLELQLFLPSPNVGTTFSIDTPGVPRHLTFVFGLNLNAASAVLSRVESTVDGDEEISVVNYLAHAELMASMGLFNFVEIGVILPFAFNESQLPATSDNATTTGGGPLADMRVLAKVPLLRGDFGLAARAVFTIPTGDSSNFLGTGYWTMYPALNAAYTVGPLRFGAEVGYRFRRRAAIGNLEQDDELQMQLGGGIEITDWLDGIAEAQLRLGVGGQTFAANENPSDVNIGVRLEPATNLFIDLGAGTAILAGYGAPDIRGFGILRYATQDEPCTAGPEDFDGFEDGDFCGDADNDQDGVLDTEDDCENDPEDMDGFRDADGCPDTDNDADGVPDAADECPLASEDVDGYEDDDGCPEDDNDNDGIPDGLDECPMDPEDLDQFQDDDGCPEPGPEQATVTVTETRILISERIYFDFDRDTIRSVSMPLLDQVASAIQQLPARRRVRVEGYTDDAGEERYNTDLSYRRARAVVEYLASRGVPRSKLDYVGYGVRNPVAPNDSPEGRALNRRVEFTILHPGERSR